MSKCPLCLTGRPQRFQSESFSRCPNCKLIFKAAKLFLTPQEEKARYNLHENDINSPGYLEFLAPVIEQAERLITKGARGLDYGCGPSPVLATLLGQKGFPTQYYDPYFFPEGLTDVDNLDFITCTEAAEHFNDPGREFARMFSLIMARGHLILMTEQYRAGVELDNWYYVKDPTHICFYSPETMRWIAGQYHCELTEVTNRLVVYRRP